MLYMLKDILKTVAVSAPVGIIFSAVILFIFTLKNYSVKNTLPAMANRLKKREFRYKFYFLTYLYIIFSRTIVQRRANYEPLSDVLGGWKIFQHKYTGLDYQVIGNVIMFIPFALLLAAIVNNCNNSLKKNLLICLGSSFAYSLFIELCQLVTKRGTFQISDLVWNTLGGLIGFIIFTLINKLYRKQNQSA